MSKMESISHEGFTFYNGFDSANLARVATIDRESNSDEGGKSRKIGSGEDAEYEFNLWTKHDCHGTQYQNNNRTWFYFGMKSGVPGAYIRLNLVNLNKQLKMFSQGMCPVFKTVPGHPHWERIREKPTYTLDHKGTDFTLSFAHRTSENPKAVTYFAFTYPFSYTDLQNYLRKIDLTMAKRSVGKADDIYYHRECAIRSLEGRRLDVITVSSHHNITTEREDRLPFMFPDETEKRPLKFRDKKIVFVSARVHPGETPSSFVLNGFLNFLLNRDDQIALHLRRSYVFKFIPMLNPDGVARGHYRTDTRGINLNRVYLDPSEMDHPTIYAARSLIRYYHSSYVTSEDSSDKQRPVQSDVPRRTESVKNVIHDGTTKLLRQVTLMTLNESENTANPVQHQRAPEREAFDDAFPGVEGNSEREMDAGSTSDTKGEYSTGSSRNPDNTGLYLYIDLHGHASKKGVFMYGNHFEDPEDVIACMLLPKLMSINDPNFHFASCNFTERNMYLIDKRDGMSREGSGRVAVYKTTGLVRSYTLECNYNTGRLVNAIPPRVRDASNKIVSRTFVPPKYSPSVFEAVGAALGPSILDLTDSNPNSRLPNSPYRSSRGVRSFLKLTCANALSESRKESSVHKEHRGLEKRKFTPLNGNEANVSKTYSGDCGDVTYKITRDDPPLVARVAHSNASFYTKRTKNGGRPRPTRRRKVKNKRSEPNPDVYGSRRDTRNTKAHASGFQYSGTKLIDFGEPNAVGRRRPKRTRTIKSGIPEDIAVIKHGAKRPKIAIPNESTEHHGTEMGESWKSTRQWARKVRVAHQTSTMALSIITSEGFDISIETIRRTARNHHGNCGD